MNPISVDANFSIGNAYKKQTRIEIRSITRANTSQAPTKMRSIRATLCHSIIFIRRLRGIPRLLSRVKDRNLERSTLVTNAFGGSIQTEMIDLLDQGDGTSNQVTEATQTTSRNLLVLRNAGVPMTHTDRPHLN